MIFSYDAVAYPAATFPQTYPDRLAVIAGLHGLAAPHIATARVLEVGGGDGFNVIALAAAWPEAQFLSFDLSGEAVARGQALVAAAGLANVRIEKADIMDVAKSIAPGGWDYVIVHGVHAWVPAPVREAIMALTARALSPEGVAFISYNALPGGHIRRAMRDMVLDAIDGIEGAEARLKAARAFLTEHAKKSEADDIVVRCMRAQSQSMLERPEAVLFHDELGECFEPQYLRNVAAHAAVHGLEFLNDSGLKRCADGFLLDERELDGADSTALVLRRIQADDFATMRFFRQSLFVRAGRKPARVPQLESLRGGWIGAQFELAEDGGIKAGTMEFKLSDAAFSQRLLDLGAGWPAHRPVDAVALDEDQLGALHRLFNLGALHISTRPLPFTLEVAERPRASALVRAQIAQGREQITTLHFETMTLDDPAARTVLPLLDGSRDRAALAALWEETAHPDGVDLATALESFARGRLLCAR